MALAVAAKHPGLVDRVAVVATPAPDSAVRWIPPDLARVDAELLLQPVPAAKHRLREMLRSQVPDGAPSVELLAHGEAISPCSSARVSRAACSGCCSTHTTRGP